jgi:SAM-dependent methyltransferase
VNTNTPTPLSFYLHGSDPDEQRRLSKLNELLNAASLRELSLSGGDRILEIGAGLGQFSRAMARVTGTRVLAIERDPSQLAEANRLAELAGESHHIELRAGDALALPLQKEEWGAFDLAHARFLLEHVPEPLRVVRSMVRAVKPGGRIVLEDDDHDLLRLWPDSPGFQTIWSAYIRTYDRVGNDPFVGRRLPRLLTEAGAIPRRITWVFFGACAGDPAFPSFVENLVHILEGAKAHILDLARLDLSFFNRTIKALESWAREPGASLWYGMSWAEGIRPQTDENIDAVTSAQ